MLNFNKISALILLPLFMSECNTIEGFGRDLERGGARIEGSARDARDGDGTRSQHEVDKARFQQHLQQQ